MRHRTRTQEDRCLTARSSIDVQGFFRLESGTLPDAILAAPGWTSELGDHPQSAFGVEVHSRVRAALASSRRLATRSNQTDGRVRGRALVSPPEYPGRTDIHGAPAHRRARKMEHEVWRPLAEAPAPNARNARAKDQYCRPR